MEVGKIEKKKLVAILILVVLYSLFLIKLTSKAVIENLDHKKLNWIEDLIVEIDENIIINPYYVVQKMNSLKDVGRVPQQETPNGVTACIGKDSIPIDKNYLYSYYSRKYNAFIVELLELKSNKTLNRWKIPFAKAKRIHREWRKDYVNSNFDDHLITNLSKFNKFILKTPLMLENKKVLIELQGMLICLSGDNQIIWKNDKYFHHSLELDSDLNLWGASYHDSSKNSVYLADQIVKIDPKNGEVLYQRTIKKIFENNPEFDLSRLKLKTNDPYHLNDIQPVKSNSKYWKQGDLFISLKGLNTVMLYRPSTRKIIWQRSVGWSNQHDIRIINDSTISVFNNNLKAKIPSPKIDGTNQFVTYSFAKDTVRSLFSSVFKKNNIRTFTQGRANFFEEDSLLYVEATDQSFCVMKDFKSGKSFKCYIPGRTKEQAGNMGWFRLIN